MERNKERREKGVTRGERQSRERDGARLRCKKGERERRRSEGVTGVSELERARSAVRPRCCPRLQEIKSLALLAGRVKGDPAGGASTPPALSSC